MEHQINYYVSADRISKGGFGYITWMKFEDFYGLMTYELESKYPHAEITTFTETCLDDYDENYEHVVGLFLYLDNVTKYGVKVVEKYIDDLLCEWQRSDSFEYL